MKIKDRYLDILFFILLALALIFAWLPYSPGTSTSFLVGSMIVAYYRIGKLEGRMGSLEGRMGSLETRMGGLEGRMKDLEQRVPTIEDIRRIIREELGK